MIIETFKTNKTIKMVADNAVIPDLVMVLTVLMVLIVLKVLNWGNWGNWGI